jgi:hypothetical protein
MQRRRHQCRAPAPGLKAAPDRVWSSQARAGSASSSVTANGAEAAVNVVCTRETSMIDDGAPHPVELLRDRHGVYGVGVSELFDFELAARAGLYTSERPPGDLILRPDWFPDNRPRYAALQKILGGMPSHEERLRQLIHHEALNRSGLPWPPRLSETTRVWWSADKQKQTRNRGIYQLSLHVINHLIGRALEEAADADAIKAARRFTFEHREHIYRAAALSRRSPSTRSTGGPANMVSRSSSRTISKPPSKAGMPKPRS